jgi:hypothetical protein
MTTSNAIDAGLFKDTLMVATDAVFENDSLKFVYLGKDNPVKQIVWLGDENENYVLVKKGLKEKDVVWLSEPKDAGDLKFAGVEIYAEILKDKENARIKADKEREEMLKKKPEVVPQVPGAMPAGAVIMKQTK